MKDCIMKILFFILLIPLGYCTFAQVNANQLVHDGENDFILKNYSAALEKMDEAMKSFDHLTIYNKRKVYYYHGKSVLELYAAAAIRKDTAALFTFRNATLEAYDDFKNCLKYDSLGIWAPKVQREFASLYPLFLQTGYTMNVNGFHEKAIVYFDACIEIVNDFYATYDLRCQSKLALHDTIGAVEDLTLAKDYLYKKPPYEVSFAPFEIYYRLAFMQVNFQQDTLTAIKTLKDGIYWLGKQKSKYDNSHNQFSEAEKVAMVAYYKKLLADMKTLKALLEPEEK